MYFMCPWWPYVNSFSILFSSYTSDWILFTELSSGLLILSSTVFRLLLTYPMSSYCQILYFSVLKCPPYYYFIESSSLVNFSNFLIPFVYLFLNFLFLINQLFYLSVNSNIWIVHESASIVLFSFVSSFALPICMSGNFLLYAEQQEENQRDCQHCLPPEKILPFIVQREEGTGCLNQNRDWAAPGLSCSLSNTQATCG